MLTNEWLFLGSIFIISGAALVALRIGKAALISFVCVQAVLVNLFVTKEIMLFGFTATASDALAVGITLSLNLLQEYWQRTLAQKAVWISFFCALFYSVMGLIQVAYMPAPTDVNDVHFKALLTPMPRIIIASLTVYIIVQLLDCQLYALLRSYFGQRNFLLRTYISTAITQGVDTVLFTFLGLYAINEGFTQLEVLRSIILVSYSIKLVSLSIAISVFRLSKMVLSS